MLNECILISKGGLSGDLEVSHTGINVVSKWVQYAVASTLHTVICSLFLVDAGLSGKSRSTIHLNCPQIEALRMAWFQLPCSSRFKVHDSPNSCCFLTTSSHSLDLTQVWFWFDIYQLPINPQSPFRIEDDFVSQSVPSFIRYRVKWTSARQSDHRSGYFPLLNLELQRWSHFNLGSWFF